MTPIYVDDAVEAIVRSIESDEHLVLNVAGDETASIKRPRRADRRASSAASRCSRTPAAKPPGT